MKLQYTVNPYLPATRQRHLVYTLVEVNPEGAQPMTTSPLNLGLVVDASRSMSIPILTEAQFLQLQAMGLARAKTVDGVQVWQFDVPKGFHIDAPSNMDFTKEALHIVADYLRSMDRFSLVAFAEDALLMVSNTLGTNKHELLQAIDRMNRIDLGDETYMGRGMEMGYQQTMRGISSDAVNRMIVLTDGYTKEEQVCYTWTRQAKKDGIVVSTMGLGLDFNEELLISLADVSGGHAYFIEDPQEIPEAFRQELAGAQSVAWRNLSLSLDMPTEVTMRRAHRVRPVLASVSLENNAIVLGDLEAGSNATSAPPSVLLEWIVPPRPAGTYRLARLELRGHAPGSRSEQTLDSQDILVRYTEQPSLAKQTDPRLMSVIQAVSAFKLQTQAFEEAQKGNVVGATQRLRLAGERLIEMGQQDLGHTMLAEADVMEKEGQMSAEGTKRLRYGTRKLTKP